MEVIQKFHKIEVSKSAFTIKSPAQLVYFSLKHVMEKNLEFLHLLLLAFSKYSLVNYEINSFAM